MFSNPMDYFYATFFAQKNFMSKLLKITKPDKTVHTAPINSKPFYTSYNRRLPNGKKWKIEEITEEEAKNLGPVDKNHVTGDAAILKVKEVEAQLSVKDKEIAELKALLAGKGDGGEGGPQQSGGALIDGQRQ